MKILLNGQVMYIDETVKGMRQALIQNQTEQLKDMGCDGLEANEMAHELYLPLTKDELLKTIKQLEIQC